jgi:hypothetical protein
MDLPFNLIFTYYFFDHFNQYMRKPLKRKAVYLFILHLIRHKSKEINCLGFYAGGEGGTRNPSYMRGF